MAENFIPQQISTFTNDTTAVNAVNNNFTAISNILEDVVSRAGVSPNQMGSTLDLNGNQIINLPFPQTANSPVRLIDLTNSQNITFVSATTGTSGHTIPFLDGTNTWSNPQTINVSGLQTALTTNVTLSGTSGNTFQSNIFNINDTANVGAGYVQGLAVNMSFGSSSALGGRVGLISNLTLTSPTSGSNSNRGYSAVIGDMLVNSSDNGTSTTVFANSAGVVSGGVFQTITNSSATNLQQISGSNHTVSMASGSSAWGKSLVNLYGNAADSAVGTTINTMLWMNNQNNTTKWTNGILIDNYGGVGFFPIASNGTIFKAGPGTCNFGIDFNNMTFNNNAFQSNGFAVTGVGTIVSGTPGVSTGTVVLNGSTSGAVNINSSATGSALNISQGTFGQMLNIAGPNNTIANQIAITATASNGSPSIQTTGSDTNISLLIQAKGSGSVVIPQSTILGTAGIQNGILTFLGTTSGSVVLTTPSNSAGLLQFASSGSFSANGSIATGLTSLGPTGSHTTVQTWLTIIDSTGATRYIPCF